MRRLETVILLLIVFFGLANSAELTNNAGTYNPQMETINQIQATKP